MRYVGQLFKSIRRVAFRGTLGSLILFMVLASFFSGAVQAVGFVGVPVPFDEMSELDCEVCHSDNDQFNPKYYDTTIVLPVYLPDRHHKLTNQELPSGTDAPNGDPNGTGLYQCLSCHTDVWNSATSEYEFAPFRDCLLCHMQETGQSTVHHQSNEARSGNCTYCHKTPAFALDRPAQAACRECHGAFKHDNGGPILDFGTCASCHNNSFSTARAPIPASSSVFPTYGVPETFHPAPRDSRGNIRGVGYTRPAPGKGSFNLFWALITNNGRDQEDTFLENIEPNGDDMNDEGGFRFSRPKINYTLVPITNNGRSYNVPKFADIVPSAPGIGGGSDNPGVEVNLALNKSASASNDEGSSYRPSNAVDGNTSSYWRTDSSRSEWLMVDLGQSYMADKVVIKWGSEFAREYEVQVSTNNYSWTRVKDENSGNGGTDEVTFSERDVRYVRVYCTREDDRGYRITELEVYNEPTSSSTSTSSPTSTSSSTYGRSWSYDRD